MQLRKWNRCDFAWNIYIYIYIYIKYLSRLSCWTYSIQSRFWKRGHDSVRTSSLALLALPFYGTHQVSESDPYRPAFTAIKLTLSGVRVQSRLKPSLLYYCYHLRTIISRETTWNIFWKKKKITERKKSPKRLCVLAQFLSPNQQQLNALRIIWLKSSPKFTPHLAWPSRLELSNIPTASLQWGNLLPPLNKCPGYNIKQSAGETSVTLELWGMRSTPLLPSFPGSLWSGVVPPDWVLSKGKIDLNCILMLNWIVWDRTVFDM